MDLNS